MDINLRIRSEFDKNNMQKIDENSELITIFFLFSYFCDMELMFQNKNKLILGDCLDVMKKMEDESVDLIYLDPPFFSNRNYEVIWGDEGEVRSFEEDRKSVV